MKTPQRTLFLVQALALASAACGPGLVDPKTHKGAPITTLTADVTGALFEGVPPGTVRGALVWSAYEPALLDCLEAVPDFDVPLDVYGGDPEAELVAHELSLCLTLHLSSTIESDSVALEPTFPSSFTIPLYALPDPTLLTGDDDARMGLAAVTVYVDGNENGALDLEEPGTLSAADTVIGSSAAVHDEDLVHALVVFREGALSPLWKIFRAIYDCPDEPQQGFSVMTVAISEDQTSVTCTLSDGPIGVALADSASMRAEVCLPNPELSEFIEATEGDAIPGGASIACEDGIAYFSSAPEAVCPLVGHFDLYGCRDTSSEAACRATFFDHTAEPPAWWPCGGDFIGFWPEDTFATGGLDELGSVNVRGQHMFTLDDLRVEVDLEDGTQVFAGDALVLLDNDGNGWVNGGDHVFVRETEDVFNPGSAPGLYVVRVVLRGETVATSSYTPVPLDPTTLPLHDLQILDAPGSDLEDGALLFTIHSTAGDGTYALEDLSLQIYLFGKAGERMPNDMLTLVDSDDDGRFGAGDTLEVRMTSSVSEWARAQLHDQNGNLVFLEAATALNVFTSITGGAWGTSVWGRFTFLLERIESPFTDGLDDIARLHVLNAEPFAAGSLVGWWSAHTSDGQLLINREIGADWFVHDDVDDDGLVSRGDVITLREAEESLGVDAPVFDGSMSLYLTAPDGSNASGWTTLR